MARQNKKPLLKPIKKREDVYEISIADLAIIEERKRKYLIGELRTISLKEIRIKSLNIL